MGERRRGGSGKQPRSKRRIGKHDTAPPAREFPFDGRRRENKTNALSYRCPNLSDQCPFLVNRSRRYYCFFPFVPLAHVANADAKNSFVRVTPPRRIVIVVVVVESCVSHRDRASLSDAKRLKTRSVCALYERRRGIEKGRGLEEQWKGGKSDRAWTWVRDRAGEGDGRGRNTREGVQN